MDVVARLRARACMYVRKDGKPGPLGTCWGWQTIAEELNNLANELEKESKKTKIDKNEINGLGCIGDLQNSSL